MENESQGEEDSVGNLSVQASAVNYTTIESILGGKNHDVLIMLFHNYLMLFIICIINLIMGNANLCL